LTTCHYSQCSKIAEKAVCRSVFLTIWHSFRLFFGDVSHWVNIIKTKFFR